MRKRADMAEQFLVRWKCPDCGPKLDEVAAARKEEKAKDVKAAKRRVKV